MLVIICHNSVLNNLLSISSKPICPYVKWFVCHYKLLSGWTYIITNHFTLVQGCKYRHYVMPCKYQLVTWTSHVMSSMNNDDASCTVEIEAHMLPSYCILHTDSIYRSSEYRYLIKYQAHGARRHVHSMWEGQMTAANIQIVWVFSLFGECVFGIWYYLNWI